MQGPTPKTNTGRISARARSAVKGPAQNLAILALWGTPRYNVVFVRGPVLIWFPFETNYKMVPHKKSQTQCSVYVSFFGLPNMTILSEEIPKAGHPFDQQLPVLRRPLPLEI